MSNYNDYFEINNNLFESDLTNTFGEEIVESYENISSDYEEELNEVSFAPIKQLPYELRINIANHAREALEKRLELGEKLADPNFQHTTKMKFLGSMRPTHNRIYDGTEDFEKIITNLPHTTGKQLDDFYKEVADSGLKHYKTDNYFGNSSLDDAYRVADDKNIIPMELFKKHFLY